MRYNRRLILLLCIVTLLLVIHLFIHAVQKYRAGVPLNDGRICNSNFGVTQEEDLHKIESYSLQSAQPLLKNHDFFPDSSNHSNKKFDFPTLVTAASANHFSELLELVENVNTILRVQYLKMDLIIFDLGFTERQKIKLRQNCNCRLERFPLENYPHHVSILHGYAWKPLVIQTVRKKYPFVMWMDASVRFTTNNITWLFDLVRNVGVMALGGDVPIASRTSLQTFSFLGEEPCLFKDKNEFEATFIVIYPSLLVEEYFMKPWVSCALIEGCMVPSSWFQLLHCDNGKLYHNCHRFDQSVLSILLYRLYHQNLSQHYMHHTFFQICKGGEEQWFLPNFMNKLLIKFHRYCY
ncbi:hypothetical protein CHS0354_037206 [Potamilus streckersoni]|uniref:Uncharacterized protein n=1 Tax=Potamilus streckersoni TaxID=2493646 RepID=A0AAE0SXR8_9BIVA|nr:hypothetical protein CHS0354_037206 [Potamilus streckersoni]